MSDDELLSALDSDNDIQSLVELLGVAATKSKYERKLDKNLERYRASRRAGQDIGFPETDSVNEDRKLACRDSLKLFYETYFPEVFNLGWSEDHLKVIDKLERAIALGELSAIAMPRGSGKTSMFIRAALWAILTGQRTYVCLIAATETKAQALLRSIKTELLHNDLLKEDFVAETHCVLSLGNRAAMANGQHVNGTLTGVEWSVGKIGFGYINHPECKATNNSFIKAMGITGDIRGEQVTLPDGGIRRPDLVLIDDPQTKQSAGSKSQVQKRHETLMGDILGLAGPGKSIAGLCACTVVYANDLADRLLDREESPEWAGQRCKLVYEWPGGKAQDLWDEYQVIYEESMRLDQGVAVPNGFVDQHFEAMHEGAVVGWDERYDRAKEMSALHHAVNLKIRDAGAFAAEYQNEPMSMVTESPFDLNAEILAKRVVSGLKRGEAPDELETITASIDVQKNLLFYVVCGWTPTSRCYILDYGTYPDQKRNYFTKSDAPISMQQAAGTDELEAALSHALKQLTSYLLQNEYGPHMVEKLCIDSRWGESTEIIRRFCRESAERARIHPSMGLYIGANSRGWQKLKLGKRDKKGVHCKLTPPTNGRGRPELLIDTNYWKTSVASRLTVSEGSAKAMVLFDERPAIHRMFAEHLSAEIPKRSVGKTGNVVTEWQQPRNRDNDWFDCLVYASALASILGVKVIETASKPLPSTTSHSMMRSVGGSSVKETARDRLLRRKKK